VAVKVKANQIEEQAKTERQEKRIRFNQKLASKKELVVLILQS
jgi:hypothetical protein